MHGRLFFAIAFVLSCTTSLMAQERSGASVSGVVKADSTLKPLEFVNIVVLRSEDSTIVTGTTSDAKGRFEIDDLPAGAYLLRLSLLGFEEARPGPLSVNSGQSEISLGTILLKETAVRLGAVTVTSQKMTFTNTIDRKVYNVQQDILSKTGSASDLLRNIPSVQVDIDGTVMLRGSESVLILLNGKPSPLMGANRGEVLQQMPASSIERIEVITNPSAKYKPDGTSGIINIVLKKETATGLNGSASASAGSNDRYNASVNLNENPGFWNVYGSYSIRQDQRNGFTTDRRTLLDSTGHAMGFHNEDGSAYIRPLSHVVNLGFEVRPDASNSLGASGHYRYRGFTRTESSAKRSTDAGGVTTEDYDRLRYDPEYEKEMGGNAFFQHNVDGDDHKVRAEFNFSHQPELEDNHYTDVFRLPAIPKTYDNMRVSQIEDQKQATVDYENRVSKDMTLEAGYAGDFNTRDMRHDGEAYDTLLHAFATDTQTSSHFVYDETIHALYATYQASFGPLSILGGLRTEHSSIHAHLVSRDSTISNAYLNLYPTLHLTYKIDPLLELQLNYSRRANRPEGDDLNPFPEYQDPRNVRAGNPRLLPELIHSVEMGAQWQTDNLTVVPSLFYRNKYNGFTRVTKLLNDSTLLTTQENLATDESAGLELVVSGNAGNTFSGNASANGFYEWIDASNLGFGGRKSTMTWSGNLNANLNLSGGTMVQVNSSYRSSRLTPQGEFKPSFVLNLGARQDLFGDRLSVVLTISDILKTLNRETILDTPLLSQRTVNTRDTRIVYLGVTWHFGQPAKPSKDKALQYDNGL